MNTAAGFSKKTFISICLLSLITVGAVSYQTTRGEYDSAKGSRSPFGDISYQDPAYGIGFDYPDNFGIREDSRILGHRVMTFDNGIEYRADFTNSPRWQNLSQSDLISMIGNAPGTVMRTVYIGDVPAMRLDNEEGVYLFFEQNGIECTFSYHPDRFPGAESADYETMLSSIRLIPQSVTAAAAREGENLTAFRPGGDFYTAMTLPLPTGWFIEERKNDYQNGGEWRVRNYPPNLEFDTASAPADYRFFTISVLPEKQAAEQEVFPFLSKHAVQDIFTGGKKAGAVYEVREERSLPQGKSDGALQMAAARFQTDGMIYTVSMPLEGAGSGSDLPYLVRGISDSIGSFVN